MLIDGIRWLEKSNGKRVLQVMTFDGRGTDIPDKWENVPIVTEESYSENPESKES